MRDPAVLVKYKAWNGPMPTTAAQAAVSTGTAIITLLQIATPSTRRAMPNEATSECSASWKSPPSPPSVVTGSARFDSSDTAIEA